jgi:hypothetical protein
MNDRILQTGTPVMNSIGNKSAKKTEMKPAGFIDDVFKREIFDRAGAAFFTTLSIESIDKAVERGDLVSHSEGTRVIFLREELIDYIRHCPPKTRKRQQEETA